MNCSIVLCGHAVVPQQLPLGAQVSEVAQPSPGFVSGLKLAGSISAGLCLCLCNPRER